MPAAPTADDLRREIKRRGVHLNTLHALLRLNELDPGKRQYRKEREGRILKFVAMLGGIREPDLVAISRLTQPTLWRLVEHWRTSRSIRVVADYNDHVPGRRAKWLQPLESADLPDGRRAYLVETAALIKVYIPLWEDEQTEAAVQEPEPILEQPAPLPAPTVVAPVEAPAPAAPVPAPDPSPIVPVEVEPPAAMVPPVPVQPVREPVVAPVIRLTGPPIIRLPVEPHYPWESDDPYRAMFEVTERMVQRRQRERQERIRRVLHRLRMAVVWIFVGAVVIAGGIVFVPLLIYLMTGWDLLLIISTAIW
jgi:hypothetical protein